MDLLDQILQKQSAKWRFLHTWFLEKWFQKKPIQKPGSKDRAGEEAKERRRFSCV